MSLRTRVTSWLLFPPFMIMAVFTSSTSLGARLSRKRFERLVFGFLVKHKQGSYSSLQPTALLLQGLKSASAKLVAQLQIQLCWGVMASTQPPGDQRPRGQRAVHWLQLSIHHLHLHLQQVVLRLVQPRSEPPCETGCWFS